MSLRIQGLVDNDVHPPRFGLAERVFSLYRALARSHQVRLLCVVPNRSAGAAEEEADGVHLSRRKRAYTSLAWRLERWGVAPMFATASAWHERAAASLLAAVDASADVWSADSLNLAPLLERRPAPLRVYLAQNVEVDFFRGMGTRLARGRWLARLARLEERALRAADLVVAVSEEDAERFAALYAVPAERLEVIENGYDDARLRPPRDAERRAARARFGFGDAERVGLFVGSAFPHNLEAAHRLVERVYPALAPDAHRLLLVGGVSAPFRRRRDPWLTALPPVPDLLPCLHAADLGLNPVTRGGGSNVKLPAYLAAGLPVVSTPFGMRGYRDLAACVTLAEPDQLGDALRAAPARPAGVAAALARYAWSALGARLSRRYERLLGRTPAVAAGGGTA